MFGSDKKENSKLDRILAATERLEVLMASSNQGLTDLHAAVAALTTMATNVASAIADLKSQIAGLQGQTAEVTDAQLETLAQTVQSAETAINAAIAPATPPTTA